MSNEKKPLTDETVAYEPTGPSGNAYWIMGMTIKALKRTGHADKVGEYERRAKKLASLLPEAERAARGGGFSAFEQGCRSLLANWMDRARFTPFGEDVLIRYLYRLEAKEA